MPTEEREVAVLAKITSQQARCELSAFLNTLSKVRSYEDDARSDDCRYDDSDGVACRLASDLDEIENERVAKLATRRVFEEIAMKPQVAAVAVETGDVNRRGRYGYAQLHNATISHDTDECVRLLGIGARWDVKDNSGQTPWDKAYLRGFDDIIALFDPTFVRTEPVEILDLD